PAGYEPTNEGDCNDADNTTYPGAPELCSNLGTDNDCDKINTEEEASDRSTFYRDADGDTFTGSDSALFCTAPAGYESRDEGDCNDANNTIYPGAAELCSNLGTDNDCDGVNTEAEASDRSTFYRDADGDGVTGSESALFCTAPAGYEPTNEGDCNDANPAIYPGAAELCNSIDDNCSGSADEGLTFSEYYPDVDGDGFGAGQPINACAAPSGYVLGRGDGCPVDPNKQAPGVCGCGIADADINGNDVIDCKDVELYMVPMTTGVVPGAEYRVRVSAMSPSAIIALTGMQLAVKFDATRIALVDVEPVEGTPLSFEIAQNINNSSAIGTLRYAIGVDAGASGLTGPADLVDLVFMVLPNADVCAQDVQLAWFENVGTFRTVLVTPPPAVSVFPTLSSLLPLDLDITDPVLAGVPESVAIPADAGSAFGAFVAAPTVTATDNCTDPIVLDLVVNYPDASGLPDATEWPIDGMFPVGHTILRWTAIDETGNSVQEERHIDVAGYALADLSITLEGLQRGASTRSIRVTAEGVSSLTDVTFNPGVGAVLATAQVKVSSTIACIEVKDPVHSLTSTTAPSIVGTRYTGSVTLLQGDSNDDDKVDIADFTLFVSDRTTVNNPRCESNARSNFDGNQFVNTADFTFISTNFFRRGESCTAGADGDAALSRISVKELRRQGLGHLDGADLNRDGWVDMRDMQIFIQGGPVTGSPSAPEGSVDSGW
ncbi:MAG: MopE-related protein, partial [Phycisphaerales bacterium]